MGHMQDTHGAGAAMEQAGGQTGILNVATTHEQWGAVDGSLKVPRISLALAQARLVRARFSSCMA
eukprot:9100704-Pyramimonas_sp.AAC.1